MKKTGIFFDFDGTLFYGTTDINFQVLNLTLGGYGAPPHHPGGGQLHRGR